MKGEVRKQEALDLKEGGLSKAAIAAQMGISRSTVENYLELQRPSTVKRRTKALVIGHGNMGRNHARVLRELRLSVQTIDPDVEAGADWASWDEWQEAGKWADVACIAVPIPFLEAQARSALMAGMDVLVEKPGAMTLEALTRLHRLADTRGLRLFVGYLERFNPALRQLRRHLWRAGQIHHINVKRLGRACDGGTEPTLDLAVHDFDVLADELGYGFEEVDVQRNPLHLSAMLRSGEVSFSLEASHLHPHKVRRLEVLGQAGTLLLDYRRQRLTFIDLLGKPHPLWVEEGEPLVAEWRAFLAGHKSSGLKAMQLAERVGVDVLGTQRLAA